jgi:hypothetical protein
MTKSRFFILGSQRSGTNLIRLILDSHPNVWVFGEPTAHWLLDRDKLDSVKEAIDQWLSKKHGKKDELLKIANQLLKKELHYFGYTTPGWTELFLEYQCIKEKLKEIKKIVFMIRNPVDVVDSIIKLKDFNVTTIKTMKLWLTDEGRSFKKRYGKILEDEDPIKWYSVYWCYKTESYFQMVENNYDVIGIKYEDLCTKPKETIAGVVNFLEIPWHDNLLIHNELPHFETTINGITNGGTKVKDEIFTKSINKKSLDSKQVSSILEITKETSERAGYKWT